MVPFLRLEQLRSLLLNHSIPHWVESNAISLDGSPEISIINLGRGADVEGIQTLIDQVG